MKILLKKSLKTEIDKLQNFTTSHNVAHVGTTNAIDFTQFTNKTKDIMTEYKTILGAEVTGKGLSADLSSGIEISKVVLKKAYDASTHQVVFTVTLAKGGVRVTNNVKDVTVTFAKDLKAERDKLKDHFISQVNVKNLGDTDFTIATVDDGIDIARQYKLITEWKAIGTSIDESKGVIGVLDVSTTIEKVVLRTKYDINTHKIVFTVTLAKGGNRVTNNVKDVTVTFAENLKVDERVALQDFTSIDVANKVGNDLTSLTSSSITNVINQYLSITGARVKGQILPPELAINKVVLKKAYDASTHQVVFTVTLAKGGVRVTNNVKDIIVTFATD